MIVSGLRTTETLMKFVLQPWQLMLIILASWINRQQQQRIDYLETIVMVLKEHNGKRRILLTDDQRRRIAVKGKLVGRKQLAEIGGLFTPDTILRWHRQLVAKKWDYSNRKEQKPGRPRVRQVIVDLTVKFAKENPTWGLRPNQRRSIECRLPHYRHHDRQHLESPRHRTSAGSQTHGIMGDIHEVALGRDGFDRLHDC